MIDPRTLEKLLKRIAASPIPVRSFSYNPDTKALTLEFYAPADADLSPTDSTPASAPKEKQAHYKSPKSAIASLYGGFTPPADT